MEQRAVEDELLMLCHIIRKVVKMSQQEDGFETTNI